MQELISGRDKGIKSLATSAKSEAVLNYETAILLLQRLHYHIVKSDCPRSMSRNDVFVVVMTGTGNMRAFT